ncbi:hypothetical protein [Streptomyces sp. NPDC007205]
MLRDADEEVARTAWRVAVVLVPEDEKKYWSTNWSCDSAASTAMCG